MTDEEAVQIEQDYGNATKSGAYLEWNLDELLGVQKQLREARMMFLHFADRRIGERCEDHLETINQTIAEKRAEQHIGNRHEEAQGLSRKILCVAKWTLVAAIVVPILAVLLAEILPSMLHPSRSSELPPAPSPTASMTATPTQSPTQSASPIESSTTSPTPEAEAKPE